MVDFQEKFLWIMFIYYVSVISFNVYSATISVGSLFINEIVWLWYRTVAIISDSRMAHFNKIPRKFMRTAFQMHTMLFGFAVVTKHNRPE